MVCVRCNQDKPDAQERTVTKPQGDAKRVLCDDCAAITNTVYPVQEIRQPAPEPITETVEDEPPAATPPTKKRRGG